jgi:GMP synthase (glutamine-hydrolysing)
LQFHPEVTHAMMCRWTVRAAHRLELPGAQDRSRQIEGRFMYDPHVAQWLDRFLDHWLGEPKQPARKPRRAPRQKPVGGAAGRPVLSVSPRSCDRR